MQLDATSQSAHFLDHRNRRILSVQDIVNQHIFQVVTSVFAELTRQSWRASRESSAAIATVNPIGSLEPLNNLCPKVI